MWEEKMTGFAAKHNQNPLGDAATVAQADYVIAGSSSLSLEAAEALKRAFESESTGGVTVVFRANNLSKTNLIRSLKASTIVLVTIDGTPLYELDLLERIECAGVRKIGLIWLRGDISIHFDQIKRGRITIVVATSFPDHAKIPPGPGMMTLVATDLVRRAPDIVRVMLGRQWPAK